MGHTSTRQGTLWRAPLRVSASRRMRKDAVPGWRAGGRRESTQTLIFTERSHGLEDSPEQLPLPQLPQNQASQLEAKRRGMEVAKLWEPTRRSPEDWARLSPDI